MKSIKHFHAPTKAILTLANCAWCGTTCQTEEPVHCDTRPKDMPIWGEVEVPTSAGKNEQGRDCCESCGGVRFFVDKVKSSYYVVERPTGNLASDELGKQAAERRCAELNREDNPVDTPEQDDLLDLTGDPESIKLDNPIVIKLVSEINESLPRGTHLQVEVADFIEFIKQTGVKPMATTKTGAKTAKALIRELIIKKKTDEQIIEAVQKQFPESNVDKKHCTKYRRELFVEKEIGPELAAVGSPDHKNWAEDNLAAAKRGPHGAYWKAWDAKQKEAEKAKKAAEAKKKAAAKKAPAKKAAAKKAPAKKAPAKASAK